MKDIILGATLIIAILALIVAFFAIDKANRFNGECELLNHELFIVPCYGPIQWGPPQWLRTEDSSN